MQDEENRRIYEVKQCSGSNSSVVGAEWDVERVKLRAERTGAERTGPHDAGRPIASRAGPLALFRSPPLILALPAGFSVKQSLAATATAATVPSLLTSHSV
jgi:hypothetical protein